MPPEKSKKRMISNLNTERKRLEQNLATLTPEEMFLPGVVGEWSVKDILAHLADWEAHMTVWMDAARLGDPVSEIESGLNWKQFDEFNQRIFERHKDQALIDVLAYFHSTHQEFMQMVEDMPEDEMLERGRYPFIGIGAVYDWLSAYAGHDRWAKTHLRRWMKERTN